MKGGDIMTMNVCAEDLKLFDEHKKAADYIALIAALKQLDTLEKMQEKAVSMGHSKEVCEISDRIINAVECYYSYNSDNLPRVRTFPISHE